MMAAVPPVLLVALGGGVGAALRWMISSWATLTFGSGFAWGTWIVNLSGSFLLGWLLARLGGDNEPLRLLLGVGVLGGFTTFSAFSLELVGMVNRSEIGLAAAYAISAVAGGMVAAYLGIALGRL
jgi:CrcB protein